MFLRISGDKKMDIKQAREFARIVAGHELCTGCGEDEGAQYPVSPVAQAFVRGAMGVNNTYADILYMSDHPSDTPNVRDAKRSQANLGAYFEDVGKTLLAGKSI